jgi:hypothetical protein
MGGTDALACGTQVLNFYGCISPHGIPPTLPVTLLMDPITGAEVKRW